MQVAAKPRKLAKEAGQVQYYTGKPCLNGHISNRWTVDGACVACGPAKRLRVSNDSRQKHLENTRRWKQDKKEHVINYRKIYQADPEKKELKRVAQTRRYARQMQAEGSFSISDIDNLKATQNYLCTICGCDLRVTGYHIEHKTPLIRGGSNWPSNLQLMCPTDNLRKQSLTNEEYRLKIGLSI